MVLSNENEESCSSNNLEVTSDVNNSFPPEADSPRPADDGEADGDGDSDEPEPEERVDLLVEEVDGQNTLERVTVNRAHLPHGEVAQRHRRKPLRPGPDRHRATHDALTQLVPGQRVGDHLDTVQVVPGTE